LDIESAEGVGEALVDVLRGLCGDPAHVAGDVISDCADDDSSPPDDVPDHGHYRTSLWNDMKADISSCCTCALTLSGVRSPGIGA
jgi:hypothetical protein